MGASSAGEIALGASSAGEIELGAPVGHLAGKIALGRALAGKRGLRSSIPGNREADAGATKVAASSAADIAVGAFPALEGVP